MTLRLKLRYIAIASLLVYTVIRFFLVRSVLEGYGVNAWLFLAIDASTAIFYVIGIEHLIIALKGREFHWRRFIFWAAVTFVAFGAPYAYIYASSRELPPSLGVGIGVIIAVLLLNAIFGIWRRIRRQKDE